MSDKLNSKQDGAIRLFGALSGVDEKYLAASEDDKGAAGKSGVLLFMRKYGKAMAAVLCLAVLGAGYVAMQTSVKYDAGETAQAIQTNDAMDMEAAASEAPMAGAMEESVLENAGESPETNGSAASGNTAMESIPESGKEKEEQMLDGVTSEQSVQTSATVEMTLAEAEALDVVGQYIPTDWPAGGEVSQVLGAEKAGEESVTLFWTYDETEDGFFVKVDNLGEEFPDWVTEEISEYYIVNEEDFTKEYVESQMKRFSEEDEKDMLTGRFGVLYKETSGYVLVRFDGNGTTDEIWELMN